MLAERKYANRRAHMVVSARGKRRSSARRILASPTVQHAAPSCNVASTRATIYPVPKPIQDAPSVDSRGNPFQRGAMVIVTLGNPREKVWGVVLGLSQEGLSIGGAELSSFDDLVRMVKEGEPPSTSVIFFPMHRIERVELDLPHGSFDSLSQRFHSRTGLDAATLLSRREENRGVPLKFSQLLTAP